jgi:hypothetical protein
MFNTRFNNGDQNTDQYFNQIPQNTYAPGNILPNMMSNNISYPLQSSQIPSSMNVPTQDNVTYADGGSVKKKKGRIDNNPYPMLAQMIQAQGKGEDIILAHINPLEAMILKDMGGSGTINKKTGLLQFGLFSNPKKWLKSVVGPAAGVVLGNMILPGVGGMIGGALGGAAGSKIRGRKDAGEAALRGLGMGAAAPTLAGLAGSGLSSLGASGVGGTFSEYGSKNAILPSLGKLFGVGSGEGPVSRMSRNPLASRMFEANNQGSALENYNNRANISGVSAGDEGGEQSFTDKLLGNTKDYLSKPTNLLTLGSLAGSFMNRPKEKKEKSPEQLAEEHKRLERALRLSPADRAGMEANLLAEEQMKRRIARQKFLPEERLGNIEPLYRRSNTPEEYKKQGKWLNYYNNPEFTGEAIPYKEGGGIIEGLITGAIPSNGGYIEGVGGGQDDDIRKDLRPKTYIVDASVVADAGDGNTLAGVEKIKSFIAEGEPHVSSMNINRKNSDQKVKALVSSGEFEVTPEEVEQLGKRFNRPGTDVLDLLVKNIRKHKGGSVKLPPKAKPLANYLK